MTSKTMQRLFYGDDAQPTLGLRSFRCAGWPIFAALTLTACGSGGYETLPAPDVAAAACTSPIASAPTAVTGNGGWEGTLTLKQTLSGKTGQSDWPVQIEFEANGSPSHQLVALGMAGDFSTYAIPDCGGQHSLLALFGAKGSREVYALHLSDESNRLGNPIQIHMTELTPKADSLRWSYDASYHAADLLNYKPYAYQSAAAAYVQVAATEFYAVSGTTLSVQAEAVGQDDKGQPFNISLTGSLQPAARIYPKANLQ